MSLVPKKRSIEILGISFETCRQMKDQIPAYIPKYLSGADFNLQALINGFAQIGGTNEIYDKNAPQ